MSQLDHKRRSRTALHKSGRSMTADIRDLSIFFGSVPISDIAGMAGYGIGGSLAAPPLPHHRTYGSVSGGSADYADRGAATEAKPSELKKLFGRAMVSAGLFASRQGP